MATTRPPGASRASTASSTSSPPPPTKTRSGSGSRPSTAGASPSTTSTATPCGGGVGPDAARRRHRGRRHHPQARDQAGRTRWPTLPQPAPTSHSTPAGGQLQLARTTARTSALVIIPPRWAKARAPAPPGQHRRRRPHRSPDQHHDRAGGTHVPAARPARSVSVHALAGRAQVRAPPPAGRGGARRRAGPCPSASGGESGDVSTAAFARRRRPGGGLGQAAGPWAETTTASSQGRPRRAKASDTDDGAGCTSRAAAPKRSARARTMPKKPGSPEASTHDPARLSPAMASSASARRRRRRPDTSVGAGDAGRRRAGGRCPPPGRRRPGPSPPLPGADPPTRRSAMASGTGHHPRRLRSRPCAPRRSSAPSTWARHASAARPHSRWSGSMAPCGHAHLEEVPGGGRLGGRRHHARRAHRARPGHLGQQLAVDLRPVEVGHHHAGGQLGDLAGHAHEGHPADPGGRRPAQGDTGEVADLDDAHVGQAGRRRRRRGARSGCRWPARLRGWPWAAATSICWTTDAR